MKYVVVSICLGTFQRSKIRYVCCLILTLGILVFGGSNVFAQAEFATPRQSIMIDRDWTFHLGDAAGVEKTSYEDRDWERVNLPHSFSMPYFRSPNYYMGYGWYRKKLHIKNTNQGKRYFLEFDGVFRVAAIYVNGKLAGTHSGGYTGFSFDVTDQVVAGENLIAVRVNNLWNARLNPRTGEHVFSGGIYRNVRLVETSDLHVTWCGTFVITPELSEEGAPVHVSMEIRNETSQKAKFVLRTTIIDPHGQKIESVENQQELAGKATQNFKQETARVDHPQLWSPEHPALYTAVSTILRDGKPVDKYTTSFGFRWIRWTADKRFFLNGQHRYFHGANVHQDHAGWGDAVSDDGFARDVALVKDASFDFIRGSDYPHLPVFADECDRQGMLFWSENSFWGIGGSLGEATWTSSAYPTKPEDQKAFEDSVKTNLAEMIRINRNHPSIIAWSMGNEVFFSDEKVMPKLRSLLKVLVQETHELDPTRPVAIGGSQRGEIDHLGDVAGYNGDGARIFIDPGIPSAVTEYGSTIADRPGKYEPGFGDLGDQPQFSWRSGQAIWCGFDHGSIIPALSRMGIIDYFRIPKRSWYWYRNANLGISPPKWPTPGVANALRLTADADTILHADGRGSRQILITILDAQGNEISNTPIVKLEIISGPGELPTGRSIVFDPQSDIAILDGKAAIEVRAYESGTIHLRASSPGLKSADLILFVKGGPKFIHGKTQIVSEHPYLKTSGDQRMLGPKIEVALNHPTHVSSELPGHEGRFANDGDPSTYWQPLNNADNATWWQLDFENEIQVESLRATFKNGKDHRYDIEFSSDGHEWKSVASHMPDATAKNIQFNLSEARDYREIAYGFVL